MPKNAEKIKDCSNVVQPGKTVCLLIIFLHAEYEIKTLFVQYFVKSPSSIAKSCKPYNQVFFSSCGIHVEKLGIRLLNLMSNKMVSLSVQDICNFTVKDINLQQIFSTYDKLCPDQSSCQIHTSHHICSTSVRNISEFI